MELPVELKSSILEVPEEVGASHKRRVLLYLGEVSYKSCDLEEHLKSTTRILEEAADLSGKRRGTN